jgi:hypothetical protein
MMDRRAEARKFCSDNLDVRWKDNTGRSCQAEAALEDISPSGASLRLDRPIPIKTPLVILYPNGSLAGQVRHCMPGDAGYLVGVTFDQDFQWSQRQYQPRRSLKLRRRSLS